MDRNFISQKKIKILSKNKITAKWNLVLNNINKCTNKNVLTYHAESDSALLDIKKRTKIETCPRNSSYHATCLTQKGTKVVPIHLTWFLKIPSRR